MSSLNKTVERLNTSSSTSTSTVVWATAFIQLETLPSIGYLSHRMQLSIEMGTVLKLTTKIKWSWFLFMIFEMKMFISIKLLGILCLIIFTRCMYQFVYNKNLFYNFLHVNIPTENGPIRLKIVWAKTDDMLQKHQIQY